MKFDLEKSISLLERTPKVLRVLLKDLSSDWTLQNEGINTWSPFDILGHLIHGENTDWIIRSEIILNDYPDKTFVAFNRVAHFKNSQGKTLNELLDEFEKLRIVNINKLKSMNISEEKLHLTGIHPEFGNVTLKQLLATWVTHDLGHITQISRVLAKQYKGEVGPWIQYLGILK